MSDVFVSYKRENLAAVGRLVEALRAEGVGVWWDQDIPPNAAWEATIEKALAAAKLVIVAWSPASVASENVKAEARWARAQGRLLQVFVEACDPPLFFGERQGVDLKVWSGAVSDAAFTRILAAVREGLEPSPPPAVEGFDQPSPSPSPPVPDVHPNNLPMRQATLIGRQAEVAQLVELLKTTDLVTVTGTGGVGKTRIAIEVGLSQLSDYEDGVWLAELAPVSDPSQVASAVARAMNIELSPGQDPVESLVDRLKLRQCLILLDNCEHVIDAVAGLAEAILEQSSKVKLLTSSQELLGVEGEQVFRLRSLGEPDAAALFKERAHAADASFKITGQNETAVASICQRLDGIPLAIEMAAARAPSLGCEGVLERLDDRFRVLTGGRRTALPRQRTLLATLDWSHGLLSDSDAAVFRRLSVFSGGFSLEAASQVAADDRIDSFEVTDALSSLVAKSLVVADTEADRARYRLLETTRAYAQEKLAAAGETAATQRGHAEYFLKFTEPSMVDYFGPISDDAFAERYFGETDNIDRALDWALGPNGDGELGIALTCAIAALWAVQSLYLEYIRWLEVAVPRLSSATPPSVRAALLTAQVAALMMNFPIRALEVVDEAIEADRVQGDPILLAQALNAKGFSLWFAGRPAEMPVVSAESVALMAGRSPSRLTAQTHMLAGYVRLTEQKPEAAEPMFGAVVSDLRSFGADGLANFFSSTGRTQIPWPNLDVAISEWRALLGRVRPIETLADLTISISVGELAWSLAKRGAPGDLEEALATCRTYAKAVGQAWRYIMLLPVALAALKSGRPLDCARLASFIEAKAARAGTLAVAQAKLDELGLLLRAELPEAELAASRAGGAEMSEDEAIQLALGGE
jgi:predicted ATPase